MEMEEILSCTVDLGEKMLSCGAEVGRVEDTMTRILRAAGAETIDAYSTVFMVLVTIQWNGKTETQSRRLNDISYNMSTLIALNGLSRDICGGRCPFEEFRARLEKISKIRNYSFPATVGLYALSGFAFSMFFGGSVLDGALAAAIGVVMCVLQKNLTRLRVTAMVSVLIVSMLGGLLANAFYAAGIHCAVDKVAIGDIMLLVPGLALTNSVRDMFLGDTISGLLRFAQAVLMSLVMAWGFALPSLLF